ncbi:MAG: MBL fold metallo-hydrolase [Myxococcota bacterium]
MNIKSFFDVATHTLTYVVWDPETKDAVVIDPVLDFDPDSVRTGTESAEKVIGFAHEQDLRVHWILETHAHADHLSGGQLLKRRLDTRVAIGEKITVVQKAFKNVFDLPDHFKVDGTQFDKLITHGECIDAGSLMIEAIATPGHTPACMSYRIQDSVFTGDTLFMPDYGTGRTDFPGGCAKALYHSVHEMLYGLPDETRVFVGHDYQPNGRDLRFETTIGESKRSNVQLQMHTTEAEFVKFRAERDAVLKAPKLLYQSIQVNMTAGQLPGAHANGIRYLTMPLNRTRSTDEFGEPI